METCASRPRRLGSPRSWGGQIGRVAWTRFQVADRRLFESPCVGESGGQKQGLLPLVGSVSRAHRAPTPPQWAQDSSIRIWGDALSALVSVSDADMRDPPGARGKCDHLAVARESPCSPQMFRSFYFGSRSTDHSCFVVPNHPPTPPAIYNSFLTGNWQRESQVL